jgi:hypothetical protein
MARVDREPETRAAAESSARGPWRIRERERPSVLDLIVTS